MDIEYLIGLYQQGHSLRDIEKMTGVDHNKMWRYLKKMGIPPRNKSEAQKKVIEEKGIHPTKGKTLSQETKDKIGESVSKNTDPQKRRKAGKRGWSKMSPKARRVLCKNAAKKKREAIDKGTKLERYLLVELTMLGYEVTWHCHVPNLPEAMHVDLWLKPSICIEIDGPTHYLPIYGEEKLDKVKASDAKKNGVLLAAGYRLIRIRHLAKTVTEVYKRKILKQVKEALDSPEQFITTGDPI